MNGWANEPVLTTGGTGPSGTAGEATPSILACYVDANTSTTLTVLRDRLAGLQTGVITYGTLRPGTEVADTLLFADSYSTGFVDDSAEFLTQGPAAAAGGRDPVLDGLPLRPAHLSAQTQRRGGGDRRGRPAARVERVALATGLGGGCLGPVRRTPPLFFPSILPSVDSPRKNETNTLHQNCRSVDHRARR